MKSALLALLCVTCTASGQLMVPLDQPPPLTATPGPRPTASQVYYIDPQELRALLDAAPPQDLSRPLDSYGLAISLPGPQGDPIDCFVAVSPVMAPQLQQRFPAIRSFIVQSADRAATGRCELAPRGLTAMLRTPRGVWMIDPWQSADPDHVVSYWLSDLPGGDDWVCHTTPAVHGEGTITPRPYSPRTTQTLRTYRLAMACTGEYGLHQCDIQGHAPNVVDPLAAIVTVVSRANVVYEADLAIHFNLVSNNDRLIFTNPDTDPYSSSCGGTGGADCSGTILNENPPVINNAIGVDNYDVGHVVTRVFGGVAYLNAVCGNSKAGGVSGIPRGGDVDPFSALVVIHEMGHQFGANHTFSGTRGRCLNNAHLSTAWEAGSGSSPMAYAGGCPVGDAPPSDNIAQFADPFFHVGSLLEIQSFLDPQGTACAATTPTANNLPQLTFVTPNTAIPPLTPFMLTAAATDSDPDVLTYSWEQFDSGVARPLSGTGSEDNGSGALLRAFPPASSPQRVFPRMSDVLSGTPTPGEQLPSVTGRTRQFRVVVRDNHPGAGGAAISGLVNIRIASGTSPFAVTSPDGGWVTADGPLPVAWSVGGTNAGAIACTSVTIRLSADDGVSFPYNLGSFSNNGSAIVSLPSGLTTPGARLRIDADGRIFFAMSRPFAIRPACIADMNADGGIDGADVEAFYAIWSLGDDRADLNQDGGVDGGDVEFFFVRWEAGC